MKKINFSLIFKITGLVFLAFAIVLGNEIRLGIDRYIKNTLETDAEAAIRNLDKFSKTYMETVVMNQVDLTSTQFHKIYSNALSNDSTKVKCLTDKRGKILNISREGVGDPNIYVILNDYQGTKSWPGYFNLSSLKKSEIETLERLLLENQDEVNTVTMEVKLSDNQKTDNSQFDEIQIKKLTFNGEVIAKNNVKGETVTFEGTVNYYSSYNLEIMFSSNLMEDIKSQSSATYKEKSSEKLSKKTLVLDYQSTMNGLKQQIQTNFERFKSSSGQDPFITTSYAEYYLLNPYQYDGKYYSTVMLKLEDWLQLAQYESVADLTDAQTEDHITVGYIFVTIEYDHLTFKALEQFIYDNSSTYFLAFMLIILISLSIGYIIIKPIRRIQTTAKHIARKEFDYPIDITRHDEMGDLARSINSMSQELAKTIDNLHQEIERVQKLEAVRKDFVSNFTHEIKTPLGIINGFSELVELEQDEKKRNEYIQIIQSETKRINELVMAMLDLSKLESQSITLSLEDVDVLNIVDECLDSMMFLFDKKHIHLNLDLDSCVIKADAFKMEMVINNLIGNALRYTDEGKEVYIHLDAHGFTVENEGAYIPEEDIEKIWLTFHKVDKARNEQGTGLGLSICKAVLDLHHFEYGVRNTEKGVLFSIEF